MVLTAVQKSQFLFDEFMTSNGIDLENVESELKVTSGGFKTERGKAQFDGRVKQQQQQAATANCVQQNEEAQRLKDENKEAIKAAANGLRNVGDTLQNKHGDKLEVLNSELENLFENSPDLEYDDFARFLKTLLENESDRETSAFALVACSATSLAKKLGTHFVWHYMRPFVAKEFTSEAETFYDPAANGNQV